MQVNKVTKEQVDKKLKELQFYMINYRIAKKSIYKKHYRKICLQLIKEYKQLLNSLNLQDLLNLYSSTDIIKVNNTIHVYNINRSIVKSCIFQTGQCIDCYAKKSYLIFTSTMHKNYDLNIEKNWLNFNGRILNLINSKKANKIKRFRFASSGECINNIQDIRKIQNICLKNKDIIFWLPTRAWHSEELKKQIEKILLPLKNLRLYYSIDTYTTKKEYNSLKNVSKMFYGNDTLEHMFGDKMVKCNKTWYKSTGIKCNNCNICWNSNKKVVYLKKH